MDEPLHVQVARALNWTNLHPAPPNGSWWGTEPYGGQNMQVPVYDRSWCSLGPYIDRLKPDIVHGPSWSAYLRGSTAQGATACEAVARLIVQLKKEGALPND